MPVCYSLTRMQLTVSLVRYPDVIKSNTRHLINSIGCQSCRERKIMVGVFGYKAINGLAPLYLREFFFILVSSISALSRKRPATGGKFTVPSATRNITKRRRSFAIAGTTLWNSLPLEIRSSSSLLIFRSRLNAYLFSEAYIISTL